MVCAGLALGACLALTPTPSAGTHSSSHSSSQAVATPKRLLYVWDGTIPGDAAETKRLLRFAKQRGFDTLALEASAVGYGEDGARDRFARFVASAHAHGLQVYALIGYSWFSVPDTAGLLGQPTGQGEGWSLVQGIAGARLFDGLVDDSQPREVVWWDDAGLPHEWFWEDTDYAAQSYLDWLAGVRLYAGDLPFVAATPAWYDSDERLGALQLNGSQAARPFASYVAESADALNVLAYRDHARGDDGILALVAGELLLGPVIVGVETQNLGPDQDDLTFWEEGVSGLSRELLRTYRALRNDAHFAGFSVHHYDSLRLLGKNGPRSGQ